MAIFESMLAMVGSEAIKSVAARDPMEGRLAPATVVTVEDAYQDACVANERARGRATAARTFRNMAPWLGASAAVVFFFSRR